MSESQIVCEQPIQGAGGGEENRIQTEGQGGELCQQGDGGNTERTLHQDGDGDRLRFRAVCEAIQKCAEDSANALKAEPEPVLLYRTASKEEYRGNNTPSGNSDNRNIVTDGEWLVQSGEATNRTGSLSTGNTAEPILGEPECLVQREEEDLADELRMEVRRLNEYVNVLRDENTHKQQYIASLKALNFASKKEGDVLKEYAKQLEATCRAQSRANANLLDENINLSKVLDDRNAFVVVVSVVVFLIAVAFIRLHIV